MRQILLCAVQAMIVVGIVYINADSPQPAPLNAAIFGGILVAIGLTVFPIEAVALVRRLRARWRDRR